MKRQFILTFVLFVSNIVLSAANSVPDDDGLDNENKAEMNSVVRTTWESYSAIKQPSAETLTNVTNYKSRQGAGYLYNQFMNIYVVGEEVVPSDPTRRTVIREPTIYNVVCPIEKQLNRELKSNKMRQEQVTVESTNILKIIISAFDSGTESFEDTLQQNHKNAATLLSVSQNVELTDIQTFSISKPILVTNLGRWQISCPDTCYAQTLNQYVTYEQ